MQTKGGSGMAMRPGVRAVSLFLGMILIAWSAPALRGQSAVKVWEEPLVIPTYQIGAPEKNPIFYSGRAYQGAKGAIYPYPILDKLTDVRENKTYHVVYLENQYVKLCVLPEIGGRILSAEDKTDNYDFFYHQHVIKPALIGMLGAWMTPEMKGRVQALLDAGKSVPEVGRELKVLPNTLHKAIRAGHLHASVKKNFAGKRCGERQERA